jgi:ribosomal-protein-alanine N-acetyltransferase
MRPADSAALARYQGDARYLEHYRQPPDARAIVDSAIAWSAQVPRRNYQLAIARSERDLAIGCIGLRCLDQPEGLAEFGCELDPELWGYGLTGEAATTLIDFGRRELRLKTVVARCAPANVRVHRLLVRLGFVRESSEATELRYALRLAALDRRG